MHTKFYLENLKENLGIDDQMIWKWISVKQGRTQGPIHSAPVKNQLVNPVMNLYIPQMQGNSWLAESNCKLLYKNEPCARLMFSEQSLPRTCWLVSLRRDLLSPEFSDAIRLRSWVKGEEGVASVYVMSGSVVLEHSWFGFSLLRSLGLPAPSNHHRGTLGQDSRWIHIVSPGATLESNGCYFGSWKTSMW